MGFRQLEFALRELRSVFGQPRFLAGLAVVGLLVGYVGPFGTIGSLPVAPRLAYWLAMIATTYGAGIFTAAFIAALIEPFGLPVTLRIAIIAVAASIPVVIVVTGFNVAFLDVAPRSGAEFAANWSSTLPIALGIVVLHFLVRQRAESGDGPPADDEALPPPLIDRLPVELRGDLVRLSMQDHYVEVETVRGKALVLLRLSDAIRETGGVDGLQIHRSHWVARDQIRSIDRQEGKVMVVTLSGTVLPVSRTYLPAVRAEGLLS